MSDIGINDEFMKDLERTIAPGPRPFFVLVRKATPANVLEELKRFKGRILKTTLTTDKEEALRKVLEQAGIRYTRQGVALF